MAPVWAYLLGTERVQEAALACSEQLSPARSSDAYLRLPPAQLKEVDDVVYEADCSMITIKEGDVDIGANACVLPTCTSRQKRKLTRVSRS